MSKILYINGDSHAAGAEAVVSFAFAEDDNEAESNVKMDDLSRRFILLIDWL